MGFLSTNEYELKHCHQEIKSISCAKARKSNFFLSNALVYILGPCHLECLSKEDLYKSPTSIIRIPHSRDSSDFTRSSTAAATCPK